MSEIAWGSAHSGVRFGLKAPRMPIESGGSVLLTLVCENRSSDTVTVFGFARGYPRSLRVSPPKPDRPHIRVSFADVNVIHPLEGFVRIPAGESAETTLDLSFAFDRRGVGEFDLAFAYDAVRSQGDRAWLPAHGTEVQTAKVRIAIAQATSLRDAGISEATEAELDGLLLTGSADLRDRLTSLDRAGAMFAARRVARVLAPGADATIGWRAFDALSMVGERALDALRDARTTLPHAESALAFAQRWYEAERGAVPPHADRPFTTKLDALIEQPELRGNLLISWAAYDAPEHGSLRLEIVGNGERVAEYRAPGADKPVVRRSKLNPTQMRAMLEALRSARVWLLRPLRERGMPDEPRPVLTIQLDLGEPLQRSIAMWNGEWRQGPAAALAAHLDRMTSEGTGEWSAARPR